MLYLYTAASCDIAGNLRYKNTYPYFYFSKRDTVKPRQMNRDITQDQCITSVVILLHCIFCFFITSHRMVARRSVVEHPAVQVRILLHEGSILHGRYICSLGHFLFQIVVHNWSIKGVGVCLGISISVQTCFSS